MTDTRNEFEDDPPTLIDRIPGTHPPAPPVSKGSQDSFRMKIVEVWIAWAPHFENALGALAIIAFLWLGWLWAWLMEG